MSQPFQNYEDCLFLQQFQAQFLQYSKQIPFKSASFLLSHIDSQEHVSSAVIYQRSILTS